MPVEVVPGKIVTGRADAGSAVKLPPKPRLMKLKSFTRPDCDRIGFHWPPKKMLWFPKVHVESFLMVGVSTVRSWLLMPANGADRPPKVQLWGDAGPNNVGKSNPEWLLPIVSWLKKLFETAQLCPPAIVQSRTIICDGSGSPGNCAATVLTVSV